MKTIAIANQKGGSGKTATVLALANAASGDGRLTLLIDTDPQGNATLSIGADPFAEAGTTYDLLMGADASELLQEIKSDLYAIPAVPDLAAVTTKSGSAYRLRRALEPIADKFDYCFIDTPPTVGELLYNALQAADYLIIPVKADVYSLQGMYQIIDTAHAIQKTHKTLQIAGVVVTQYNGRPVISRSMRDTIEEKAAGEGIPYLGTIRQGIAVQEAGDTSQSIFDYAPKSRPALDYAALYKKIKENI